MNKRKRLGVGILTALGLVIFVPMAISIGFWQAAVLVIGAAIFTGLFYLAIRLLCD